MNWNVLNHQERQKEYYEPLRTFVQNEYQQYTCYPPYGDLFKALQLTPYDKVKCVILGQDPYHEPNEAMGLSFSVPKGQPLPPSLQNIFKEIKREYGYEMSNNGDLTRWAKQGVLLLNTVLSVRIHQANSHKDHGWEQYTDAILSTLNQKDTPVVFMLWGKYAQAKKALITNPQHLVLMTSHPSPLSVYRGFDGCGHFKKCNEFLQQNQIKPIDWYTERMI